jgi:hypothetical protein
LLLLFGDIQEQLDIPTSKGVKQLFFSSDALLKGFGRRKSGNPHGGNRHFLACAGVNAFARIHVDYSEGAKGGNPYLSFFGLQCGVNGVNNSVQNDRGSLLADISALGDKGHDFGFCHETISSHLENQRPVKHTGRQETATKSIPNPIPAYRRGGEGDFVRV